MKENKVIRSLYYYDIKAYTNNNDFDKNGKIVTDFFNILKNEQQISNDYKKFFITIGNDNELFIIVDNIDTDKILFRMVLCKKDSLPFIEKNGILENIGKYIDNDQNIAEITHCIYYKKEKVLGIEFNFFGARANTFATYLSLFPDNGISYASCQPKLNNDVYSKLISGKDYTLFNISLKTNSQAYTNMLSNKSIFRAIVDTVPDGDCFEIKIKKRRTKKNKNKGFNLPLTEEEIKKLIKGYREDIEYFTVSQGTMSEKIDLLSDKFVSKVSVIRTEERTINSQNMYSEIDKFFQSDVHSYC